MFINLQANKCFFVKIKNRIYRFTVVNKLQNQHIFLVIFFCCCCFFSVMRKLANVSYFQSASNVCFFHLNSCKTIFVEQTTSHERSVGTSYTRIHYTHESIYGIHSSTGSRLAIVIGEKWFQCNFTSKNRNDSISADQIVNHVDICEMATSDNRFCPKLLSHRNKFHCEYSVISSTIYRFH